MPLLQQCPVALEFIEGPETKRKVLLTFLQADFRSTFQCDVLEHTPIEGKHTHTETQPFS